MTITPFTGSVPARTQSQVDFNTNVQAFLQYISTLGPEINTSIAEIAALASVTNYSGSTTYNLPDTVYGSDGLTYRCAGTNVLGDDPVTSSTGDWVGITITMEDIVTELKKINRFIFDPQRMLWHVAPESKIGPGEEAGLSYRDMNFDALTAAAAWTNIAASGASGQVSVDDTYATIVNITSSSGVLTNLFLPGVTAGSDVVTARITVDGVVYTLAFTADNATDRFVAGLVVDFALVSDAVLGYQGFVNGSWDSIDVVSGIAFRRNKTVMGSLILRPDESLGTAPCVRFEDSLKVEMKCSDVSTTTYRDYGAASYIIDQY